MPREPGVQVRQPTTQSRRRRRTLPSALRCSWLERARRLPCITGQAKHHPEIPAEVARLVGAVTVCVVGGVWIRLRVVDSFGQLGGAVVLKGLHRTGASGMDEKRRLSSPERMSERSTSWPEVTAWRTFSGALPPIPRSSSSKRNWTAEGSPAEAAGQVSGQGRGQGCWLAQTLCHCSRVGPS